MQLIYKDLESFYSYIENKKVYFWGIGVSFKYLQQKYHFSRINIEGYIDKKFGNVQNIGGRYINLPEILKNFSEDSFIVISCDAYNEISTQLENWGYKKYIHYVDGVHLENSILEYKYIIEGKQFAVPVSLEELDKIEREIKLNRIKTQDVKISELEIIKFENQFDFASFYMKDSNRDYWRKIHEYWFAYHLLELEKFESGDVYVDIGSSSTPWVYYLREQLNIKAYGVDLISNPLNKPYYIVGDATNTKFQNNSVKGISLQSSFCLFEKEGDIRLLEECFRILKKGGKVIISPLYLYPRYISGVSAIYYGKGYADEEQEEIIRDDCAEIRMSRYYDVETLKERLINTCKRLGGECIIHIIPTEQVLEYKFAYLKFVLEIIKKE